MDKIPISIEFHDVIYKGFLFPQCLEEGGFPQFFRIILNDTYMGDLTHFRSKWIIESTLPSALVELIIEYIIIYIG